MNIADWIALIVFIALFIAFWSIGPVQILMEHWRRGEKKEGIKRGFLSLIGVIIFLIILIVISNNIVNGSGSCPSSFPSGYDC